MYHTCKACPKIIALFFAVFFTASCNNHVADIPFPLKDGAYPQPVAKPLLLGPEKKLHLSQAAKGALKTRTQPLNIESLPYSYYDTAGFKPLTAPTSTNRFNFDKLPSASFNLQNVAWQPLRFKTEILPLPIKTKIAPLVAKANTTLDAFDMSDLLGFKSKMVFAVFNDADGLVWIGTSDGLYRYDGEYLCWYKSVTKDVVEITQDKAGRIWFLQEAGIGVIDIHASTLRYSAAIKVPASSFSKMVTDKEGRIWVSHATGLGVYVISPGEDRYQRIGKANGLSNENTQYLSADAKNNIWVTTLGGGTNIINCSAGNIKYLGKAAGLASDSVSAIAGYNSNKFWLAAGEGLNAVDIRSGTISYYNTPLLPKAADVLLLLSTSNGMVWIASVWGVSILDPNNNLIKNPAKSAITNNSLGFALAEDNKQRVWASQPSDHGLTMIAQDGRLFHPLGIGDISTLMQDSAGSIWAGTTDSGIALLTPALGEIRHISRHEGLSDEMVQNIAEISGKIWVCSYGGVDVIDRKQNTLTRITLPVQFSNDSIVAVIQDSRQNIWMSGLSNGVYITNPSNNVTIHLGVAEGLSDGHISDIKLDSKGRVWVATLFGGIDIIDLQKTTITNFDRDGAADSCDKVMVQDGRGRMWIGTDKGLLMADMDDGTITNISTNEGMADNAVVSVHEYNGSIVAGTHNKVNIITPPASGDASKRGRWAVTVLAQSGGLVKSGVTTNSNTVTKKGQYLWGDNGITILQSIKPEEDSCNTLITGLNILNTPKYFVQRPLQNTKDTIFGADTFYVKGQIPVGLPGINTGEGFGWDSVYGPYNLPVNLRLPYDKNYIQFQFGQANLGREDGVLYSYVLLGVDKQWSSFSSQNFSENYLNLSPGNYIFKVCSQNSNGLWGQPVEFKFTVLAPWWQSITAYCLYVLVTIVGLWLFVYWRGRRLIDANRLLEQKIALRTAEVQAQKEELTAQRDQLEKAIDDLQATQKQLIQSEKMASLGELTAGIAHEIQNPLNFVNNFAEVSKELMEEMLEEIELGNKDEIKALAEDVAFNLGKINHHGKRADAIVKGMLEHSRKTGGKKEPVYLNGLVDEYLKVAYHGFRSKHISFIASVITEFDPELGKVNLIQQDMGRVLLNLFNNAFYAAEEKWRAAANTDGIYTPTVSISTKKIGDFANIIVKDNGAGIAQAIVNKIFQPFFTTKPTGQGTGLGLSLSYDIVTAHGGTISVVSTTGDGAEFTVRLPIG